MKESSESRLMDRCLEVDKGTQHQVGRGRLWFPPDTPLKGLTSDAAPHPSLHPAIPLSNFLSSLHSEWTNSVFPLDPLRDRGPHIYPSREREGERAWKRKKMHKTCLTLRTQNLEKADVRMKAQTEPGRARPTGLCQLKTTHFDKREVPHVERWSLLQRKHVRWLKWGVKCDDG